MFSKSKIMKFLNVVLLRIIENFQLSMKTIIELKQNSFNVLKLYILSSKLAKFILFLDF